MKSRRRVNSTVSRQDRQGFRVRLRRNISTDGIFPTTMNETLAQFNRNTEKIRRRAAEVQALANERITYNDQRVKNAESNVSATIKEVYGELSSEYPEFRGFTILTGGMNRQPILQRGQFNYERQRKFESCIPNAVSRLNNLVNRRVEQLLHAMVCPSCDELSLDTDNTYCLADGSHLRSPSYDGDADTLIIPSDSAD